MRLVHSILSAGIPFLKFCTTYRNAPAVIAQSGRFLSFATILFMVIDGHSFDIFLEHKG